ncbi:response regulator transcription factor [soil metagenome]
MAKILLVEDDEYVVINIVDLMRFENHFVDVAGTAHDASAFLKTWTYDVIILDLSLPDSTGFEVLRDYRQCRGEAPVLILTGRVDVADKITGFNSGCDDYLTKPFHIKELSARVRSLLRRPRRVHADLLSVGDIQMNTVDRRVNKAGEEISLPPIEFQFLEFMLRNQNQPFSSDTLFKHIWAADSTATTEAVKSVVRKLRKKLDPDGQVLQTLHGTGYILRSDAPSHCKHLIKENKTDFEGEVSSSNHCEAN